MVVHTTSYNIYYVNYNKKLRFLAIQMNICFIYVVIYIFIWQYLHVLKVIVLIKSYLFIKDLNIYFFAFTRNVSLNNISNN